MKPVRRGRQLLDQEALTCLLGKYPGHVNAFFSRYEVGWKIVKLIVGQCYDNDTYPCKSLLYDFNESQTIP